MGFFEELEQGANRLAPRWGDWETGSFDRGRKSGIDATIEALREMMVGEPMNANIQHGKLFKGYKNEEYLFTNFHVAGHHGTDGDPIRE